MRERTNLPEGAPHASTLEVATADGADHLPTTDLSQAHTQPHCIVGLDGEGVVVARGSAMISATTTCAAGVLTPSPARARPTGSG